MHFFKYFFTIIIYVWLSLNGCYASTILFYGSGDNNLSKRLLSDLLEIQSVSISPDDKLLAQLDFDSSDRSFTRAAKRAKLPNRIYKNTTRFELNSETVGKNLKDFDVSVLDGEPNMDSLETFIDFLQWGKSKAGNGDISLVMWNHGHSILGFGGDEQNGKNKSPDHLTQPNIKAGIQIAGLNLNFLAFDTCLLGSINTILQFNDVTELLIANPEVDYGPGFDYAKFLPSAFRSANVNEFIEIDHSSWSAHHTQFMDELFRCHTTYKTINQSEHVLLSTLLNDWVDSLTDLNIEKLAQLHNIRRDCVQYSIPDVNATEDITKYVDLMDLLESIIDNEASSELLSITQNLRDYLSSNIIRKVSHGFFDGWMDRKNRGISIYWPELSEESLNYFKQIKNKYIDSFGNDGTLDKLFGEKWVNFLEKLFELNSNQKLLRFRPNQLKPRQVTTQLPYGFKDLPLSKSNLGSIPYVKLLDDRSEATPTIEINYDASIDLILQHDDLANVAGYSYGDISLLQYVNGKLFSKVNLGETYTRYLFPGSNSFESDCKTYFIHSPHFVDLALPINWHEAHNSSNWGYFPFRYGPDPRNLDQFEHYLGICKKETLMNGNTILELVDVIHNDTEGLSIKGHAELEPGGWLFPEYLVETFTYDDEGEIRSLGKELKIFEDNLLHISENIYTEIWGGRENPARYLHNIKFQDNREYYFTYELKAVSFTGEHFDPIYFIYQSGWQGFTTSPNPYLGLKISRQGFIDYYSNYPDHNFEVFGKTSEDTWDFVKAIKSNDRGYFRHTIQDFKKRNANFYKVTPIFQ